jgi:hypothetical protein
MKWVTRGRPKTDRIACPWLIRRFIDPDAEILYVPAVDRKMPEVDFDALDLPATETLPVGIEGATRSRRAGNHQRPRQRLGPQTDPKEH